MSRIVILSPHKDFNPINHLIGYDPKKFFESFRVRFSSKDPNYCLPRISSEFINALCIRYNVRYAPEMLDPESIRFELDPITGNSYKLVYSTYNESYTNNRE